MTTGWLFVPFGLQGVALAIDEMWFHRRRGLPTWERIGHPIDTALFGACFVWLVTVEPAAAAVGPYVLLAALSCLVITKDEFVHAQLCGPAESWLHALLFVLHPIVLGLAGYAWWSGGHDRWLAFQLAAVVGFFMYQVGFWGPWKQRIVTSDRQ